MRHVIFQKTVIFVYLTLAMSVVVWKLETGQQEQRD